MASLPSFVRDPATVRHTVGSGLWSDPAIWDAVPGDGDSVVVTQPVVLDLPKTPRLCELRIDVGGELRNYPQRDTEIWCQHAVVEEGGALDLDNYSDGATTKLILTDTPIDPAIDPEQLGNGLLARGKVKFLGAYKTSWARLTVPPRAGDTELHVDFVAGWQPGDRLILPDTHQLDWYENHANKAGYRPQWETAKVLRVLDPQTVELEAPLLYNHLGTKDDEFLPHVGNLSRSIQVKSENNRGTRGYCMFMDRCELDVRFVQFSSLGRTRNADPSSKGGRYPIHLHHLWGPAPANPNPDWQQFRDPWQWLFAWNSITCGLDDHQIKWGIQLHDTHHGFLGANVIHNWYGAGVAVTAESFRNVIQENLVVRVGGTGSRERPADPGKGWIAGSSGPHGTAGTGIWLRGPFNYVLGNIASCIYGGGYSYGYDLDFRDTGYVKCPMWPGADIAAGEYQALNCNATPLFEFRGNKSYGAGPGGLTGWRLGYDMNSAQVGVAGIIEDQEIWHCYDSSIYMYESNFLTFKGTRIRGDTGPNSQGGARVNWAKHGWHFEDYLQSHMALIDCDVRGVLVGFDGPWYSDGVTQLEGCYFDCPTGVVWNIGWRVSGGDGVKPKSAWINNCRFAAGTQAIRPQWLSGDAGNKNVVQSNQIWVYNYQGVQGDNFRVYFAEQVANFVLPKTGMAGGFVGAPVAGLTNQQNWTRYRVAACGEVAPANAVASRPEIAGLIA